MGGRACRLEIQEFAGALQAQRARKGIILMAEFTEEAERFASILDSTIVPINGMELASLVADHSIGVSAVATYEMKRADAGPSMRCGRLDANADACGVHELKRRPCAGLN